MGDSSKKGLEAEALVFVPSVAPEDIIPENAIRLLPFSQEPLSEWSGTPDVHRYLATIYDRPITVQLKSKPPSTRSSSFMADHIMEQERKRILRLIKPFEEQARRGAQEEIHGWRVANMRAEAAGEIGSPGPPSPDIFKPTESARLGRVLKGLIAWSGTVQSLLEESNFFSIAHLLESENDLNASVTLAAHGHYRQACQVLRGFIESAVLPLHFSIDMPSFALWKNGSYRVPPIRGGDGLLAGFIRKGVLPSSLGSELSQLYLDLNDYVHGAEKTLALSGVYEGKETRGFRTDHFAGWESLFSKSVELGLQLLRISVIRWESQKNSQLTCKTCHGTEWKISERVIAGEEMISLVCSLCGSIQNFRADEVEHLESDS